MRVVQLSYVCSSLRMFANRTVMISGTLAVDREEVGVFSSH